MELYQSLKSLPPTLESLPVQRQFVVDYPKDDEIKHSLLDIVDCYMNEHGLTDVSQLGQRFHQEDDEDVTIINLNSIPDELLGAFYKFLTLHANSLAAENQRRRV
jgi:hypothetical protein